MNTCPEWVGSLAALRHIMSQQFTVIDFKVRPKFSIQPNHVPPITVKPLNLAALNVHGFEAQIILLDPLTLKF